MGLFDFLIGPHGEVKTCMINKDCIQHLEDAKKKFQLNKINIELAKQEWEVAKQKYKEAKSELELAKDQDKTCRAECEVEIKAKELMEKK